MRARLKAISSLPAPESVLDLPCCCIRGEGDLVIRENAVADFRNHCANLEVHTIDGPHLLAQARPKECAELIGSFVRRISANERLS